MLRESGLSFPHRTYGRGMRGVGGTRNCDWWFTDQAILLDTAGRYTTESEDQAEWLAFLDMIRKARPRTPINGAVVAISISDLVEANDDQLADHVEKVRARMLELTERLQVVFPVYVVLTKCDLLEGFVETFGGYSKKERAQYWGFTLPYPRREDGDFEHLVTDGLADLRGLLDAERLRRLGPAKSASKKAKVYSFPLQFAACQVRVREFLTQLGQPNPYHEMSTIRGVYFTSGTQEGQPLDRVLAAMSSAAGVAAAPVAEDGAENGESAEKKAYFIDDVFDEVVFDDAGLARSSAAAEKRRALLQTATWVGSAVAFVLVAILLIVGYAGNSNLISRAQEICAAATDFDHTKPADLEREDAEPEAPLARLRALFIEVDDEYGSVRSQLLGATNEIYEDLVRPLYVRKLRDTFVRPIQGHLQKQLEAAVRLASGPRGDDGAPAFDVRLVADQLTAYTMLGGETRLDRAWLVGFLRKRALWTWAEMGTEASPVCRDHRDVFIERVASPVFDDWQYKPNEAIIEVARDLVEGNDVYAAKLRDVLAESGQERKLGVGEILQGPYASLLDGVGVTQAFASHVGLERELEETGAKLGGDGGEKLKEARREAAIENWLDMLSDLKPKRVDRLDEAVEVLPKLAGEDSPYIDAYKVVCRNLANEGVEVEAGDVSWLANTLVEIGKIEPVVHEFCKGAYSDRVVRAAQQGQAGAVQRMVDAFGLARRTIHVNVSNADAAVRVALEDSLMNLVRYFEFALAKEVFLEARSVWGRGVGSDLREFARKLPFQVPASDYVSVDEFEQVFRPGGTIEEAIEWIDFLERLPQVEFAPEFIATRRYAKEIRDAMFRSGSDAQNTFVLKMLNVGNISETKLQVGRKGRFSTALGKVDATVTWKATDGARLDVSNRGSYRARIDKHEDRAWGLIALLGEAEAGEATIGSGKVRYVTYEWTLRDDTNKRSRAKVFVRTESGPNPLEPGFFRHPFSTEVFLDPE